MTRNQRIVLGHYPGGVELTATQVHQRYPAIGYSSVVAALRALERQGYVTSREDNSGAYYQVPYRITPKGVEALRALRLIEELDEDFTAVDWSTKP